MKVVPTCTLYQFLPIATMSSRCFSVKAQTSSPDQRRRRLEAIVNLDQYPFHEERERSKFVIGRAREDLENKGVATLNGFIKPSALRSLTEEALHNKPKAFYTNSKSTHNIYQMKNDPSKPLAHINNQQMVSSKGCITTDQIPSRSFLKALYYDPIFQKFLQEVLQVKKLYPYEDPLSSINVHYASEGQELGWHFDNSEFAITLLLQRPEDGGVFEYVPSVRDSDYEGFKNDIKPGMETDVKAVLDGTSPPQRLEISPGTLVLFRGRDCLHRVTKVVGDKVRMLVVFAYNEKKGIKLPEESRMTFFGRTGE